MDIDRDRALGIKEGPLDDAAFYEIYPDERGRHCIIQISQIMRCDLLIHTKITKEYLK